MNFQIFIADDQPREFQFYIDALLKGVCHQYPEVKVNLHWCYKFYGDFGRKLHPSNGEPTLHENRLPCGFSITLCDKTDKENIPVDGTPVTLEELATIVIESQGSDDELEKYMTQKTPSPRDFHLFVIDNYINFPEEPTGYRFISALLKFYKRLKEPAPPVILTTQYEHVGLESYGIDPLSLGWGEHVRHIFVPRQPMGERDTNETWGDIYVNKMVKIFLEYYNVFRQYAPLSQETSEGTRVCYDKVLVRSRYSGSISNQGKVRFLKNKLAPEKDDSVVRLLRFNKGYIEYIDEIEPGDLNRLLHLAQKTATPIVLFWKNAPVATQAFDYNKVEEHAKNYIIIKRIQDTNELSALIDEWVKRLNFCDTVVGGTRLAQARNKAMTTSDIATSPEEGEGQAIFITGPTGSGKTGVAKWCHAFSSHFKDVTAQHRALEEAARRREQAEEKSGWRIDGDNPILQEPEFGIFRVPCPYGIPPNLLGRSSQSGNSQERVYCLLNLTEPADESTGYPHYTNAREGFRVPLFCKPSFTERIEMVSLTGGFDINAKKSPMRDLISDFFQLTNSIRKQIISPWKEWVQKNCVGIVGGDDFISEICGAIPTWTGAQGQGSAIMGKLLEAANNTLFLNEVGDMSQSAQGMLLELIERGGPYQPRFAPANIRLFARNVKFILATDRSERLRPQLRNRCVEIRVPSLGSLKEEGLILDLAQFILYPNWFRLNHFAERLLEAWEWWPGNYRDFNRVLQRAASLVSPLCRTIGIKQCMQAMREYNIAALPTDDDDKFLVDTVCRILDESATNETNEPNSEQESKLANPNEEDEIKKFLNRIYNEEYLPRLEAINKTDGIYDAVVKPQNVAAASLLFDDVNPVQTWQLSMLNGFVEDIRILYTLRILFAEVLGLTRASTGEKKRLPWQIKQEDLSSKDKSGISRDLRENFIRVTEMVRFLSDPVENPLPMWRKGL